MSLRAIRKRESQCNSQTNNNNSNSLSARSTLFSKNTTSLPKLQPEKQRRTLHGLGFRGATTAASINSPTYSTANSNSTETLTLVVHNLENKQQQQQLLLGRSVHSNPELHYLTEDSLERFASAHARLVRTKSEGDIDTLLNKAVSGGSGGPDSSGRMVVGSAKSEVCLQSISSHSYPETPTISPVTANMQRAGVRLPCELSQSAYATTTAASPISRRMSDESSSVGGSPMRSSTRGLSSSALTLSSTTTTTTEPNAVVRVPIIGYEVMEERARFTVYKLRVENPMTNDCWLVLRRYTDFVRLNNKLKQLYPHINLVLPRKKIFGDNFNSVFLDNRVQGLQMFVNSVMAKEEMRKCKIVREFFCLDEPPSYSESMEECRAIFEAQEETIAHLKLQISNKNDLILNLQQKLRDELHEKEQMQKKVIDALTGNCPQCGHSFASSK